MHKRYILVMISIFISITHMGCASSSRPTQPQAANSNSPVWYSDPYDGSICNKVQHLCASGVGKKQAEADANAKSEIVAYFGTKIKSSQYHLATTKEESSSVSKGAKSGEDYQNSQSGEDQLSMSTTIDGVLQATQIVAKNKNGEDFYSLAQMNKKKVQQYVESKIESIQRNIQKLNKYQSKSVIPVLNVEYQQLFDQSLLLQLVDGDDQLKFIKSAFDSKMKSLEALPSKKVVITTTGSEDLAPYATDCVETVISEVGHEIVENANADATTTRVQLKVSETKSHSNIEGFEKWRIAVTISSKEGKKETGRLLLEEELSGRSKAHVNDQLRKWLSQNLSEKIYLLNL
ncbi:MAG: hypothetical protein QE271_08600 [Bacteriovoracaceae bacterium]|nr:hypothetical protein [Bacteriovoracaceae bacterium]